LIYTSTSLTAELAALHAKTGNVVVLAPVVARPAALGVVQKACHAATLPLASAAALTCASTCLLALKISAFSRLPPRCGKNLRFESAIELRGQASLAISAFGEKVDPRSDPSQGTSLCEKPASPYPNCRFSTPEAAALARLMRGHGGSAHFWRQSRRRIVAGGAKRFHLCRIACHLPSSGTSFDGMQLANPGDRPWPGHHADRTGRRQLMHYRGLRTREDS